MLALSRGFKKIAKGVQSKVSGSGGGREIDDAQLGALLFAAVGGLIAMLLLAKMSQPGR